MKKSLQSRKEDRRQNVTRCVQQGSLAVAVAVLATTFVLVVGAKKLIQPYAATTPEGKKLVLQQYLFTTSADLRSKFIRPSLFLNADIFDE